MSTSTTRSPIRSPIQSIGDADAAPSHALAIAARRFTMLDLAMLASLALTVVCHILAARLAIGWVTAAATDVLVMVYLAALAALPTWRPLLLRLFVLGLVAGVLELFTDASGEHIVHSLSYPAGVPSLWDSPIYMPLSWVIVLTQLGYLGWRLRGFSPRLPLWSAALLTGLAGGVIVPFYEEMAYSARWWRYAAAPGLGHTPFYVMLFEGAIAALLPLILSRLPQRSLRWTLGLGIVVGLWMPCAALFSWLLIGR